MAIPLPDLCPERGIVWVPGEHPVALADFLDVTADPLQHGSIRVGATLELSYELRKSAEILPFWIAWRDSFSGYCPLILPAKIVAPVSDPATAARILAPIGCAWHFAEKPNQTSTRGIHHSISIKLVTRTAQSVSVCDFSAANPIQVDSIIEAATIICP